MKYSIIGEVNMEDRLLDIQGLVTEFQTEEGVVAAVDGVDLYIKPGEILGLVGESGCGKSVTSLSVMRLVPNPPGRIVGGEIRFEGHNLLQYSDKKIRSIRGNDIAMIFQEPMTSLNPVYTIGEQIGESLRLHMKLSKKEARLRSIEILKKVNIPRPDEIVDEYPHQLSGGMRQRVMIAMAMSCNPKLLIADEPTTALDVTIQAQILDLMRQLNEDFQTAILFITHDLGVVAEMCHRIVVMYAGKVVEEGEVSTIFRNPKHPYTQGLLKSIPKIKEKQNRLYSIPGNVPNPAAMPRGCRFAPRCEFAVDRCRVEEPYLIPHEAEHHRSACWLHIEEEAN
jgi:peptide/nickel transport system ATP-binding protein